MAQIGKLDEAIDAFKKAISIRCYAEPITTWAMQPENEALTKFSPIPDTEYYNMGNDIEAFTKALSIQPDYAAAYNNMGTTLKDQGKPDEAIAISIKPDYADNYNNIGNTLIA